MKIYTRKGDDGTTCDLSGARVKKNSPAIVACGEIDELSAAIGLVRPLAATPNSHQLNDTLTELQRKLIQMAAVVSDTAWIKNIDFPKEIELLEKLIDKYAAMNGDMKTFIIPGDNELSARMNFARTICRRTERSLVTLAETREKLQPVLAWFNRLGDLLFEMSR
ncbi:MAG TPA: cob(I)yrinic acid a,c-diamide adenosyltransferase [Phycisphaerae bacterium]|nr:cob(I)yrinic acid a,c-diamide adenosyltransferase [Phycisphaerae bacterium]HPS52526.1 cob(I)yrinic acid a,c-diamide adenosyltransferase [Phycisphaerae bacterium]